MTRVLYLTDTLNNGGAERQLTLLLKNLPPDWECHVWSLSDGPFVDEIRKTGIPLEIYLRRWRWDITPFFNLIPIIKRWNPNLIHALGYTSSVLAFLISMHYGIPWIGNIRRGNVPAKYRRSLPWILGRANRVIANSKAGLRSFNIAEESGRIVYNGFDNGRLPINLNTEKINPSFTIVMVARMVPEKDYQMFIEAAKLSQKQQSWQFLAIGSGVQSNYLMESAAKQGVSMRFIDGGNNVIPHIYQANVGVLLTQPNIHQEGFSNVIMEYMACGLPVICTNSGGNRELVLDGETGFIIPPENVDILVEKLLWLYQNPQDAINMGSKGRQHILSEFSIEKLISNTLNVYKEAIGQDNYESRY